MKKKETSPEEEFIPEEEADSGRDALRAAREKLEACLKEKQEYLAGWQRAKADYVNARRDAEKRLDDRLSFERRKIFESLLAPLDSFEHALAEDGADGAWRTGVERIVEQFRAALRENGVEAFGASGDPFDPRLHDPVGIEPTEETEKDQTVAEVLGRGYRDGNGVIRAARVRIFQSK